MKKIMVFVLAVSLSVVCAVAYAENISEEELMNAVSQTGQMLSARQYDEVILLLEPKLPPELGDAKSTAYIGFYAVGYQNLGMAYLMTYKLEESVAAFKKASAALPEWSAPYYLLGQAYFGLGDAEKSIKCVEKAMEMDPESITPDDYIYLISDYAALGQKQKAEDLMREAKERFPEEFKNKTLAP